MKAAHHRWCIAMTFFTLTTVVATVLVVLTIYASVRTRPHAAETGSTVKKENIYQRFKQAYSDDGADLETKVQLAEKALFALGGEKDFRPLTDTTAWLADFSAYGNIELGDSARARTIVRYALARLPPDADRSSAMWLQLNRLHQQLRLVDTTYIEADSLARVAASHVTGRERGYLLRDRLRRALGERFAFFIAGLVLLTLLGAVALWIARIEHALDEDGLKQYQLAERLGISRQVMSKIMNETTRLKVEMLIRIAQALGRSPAWFLEPESKPESDVAPREEEAAAGRLDFVIPQTNTVIRSIVGRWVNPEKVVVPVQVGPLIPAETPLSVPESDLASSPALGDTLQAEDS